MDILAVREATKFAADYARSGKVVSLSHNIKVHTYEPSVLLSQGNAISDTCFTRKKIFTSGSNSDGMCDVSLLRTQYERSGSQVFMFLSQEMVVG
jgi:hypothetical protein